MGKSQKTLLKTFMWMAIIYVIFFQFQTVIRDPIFNILVLIYSLVGDFGVAIILLTVVVRLALWPMVSKQFKQQKKMQEIQPELAKIKQQAKGNKTLEASLMQELYKEKEISPGGSMLTLLVQMPIFIAIFQIIRIFSSDVSQISSITYPFLHGLPRIAEILADSNTFYPHLFGFIDLTHSATQDWVILVLAILSAVFQFLQTQMTLPNQKKKNSLMKMFKEVANGKEMSQGEIMQRSMGSMTKFFPVMTFFVILPFPGALVLYYAVTSAAAIIQQKIILRSLTNELEEVAGQKPVKTIPEAKIVKTAKSKHGTTVRRLTVDAKKGGKK